MIATLRVLPFLVHMHVRSMMEYRGGMILGWVAMAFSYASVYTAIALIVLRFEEIGGWNWAEVALLLAFHLLGYSLGASFSFVQFRVMEDLVQRGNFDTLLVKPISPWAYIAFSGFNIGYAGHVVLAVGLMGWALSQAAVEWNLGLVLYLLGTLANSGMITASLLTMIGATALVWVRSRHIFWVYFGFWELARYPLNIFPTVIQAVMLTVMPLAFMSYVPVAVLLGKQVPLLGAAAGPLALLAGPVTVLLAMAYWRWCLRNYQGAGG